VFLLVVNFIIGVLLHLLYLKNIHNTWLAEIYFLIETITLTYYFKLNLNTRFKNKHWVYFVVLYTLIWLFSNIKLGFSTIEPVSFVLSVLVIMLLTSLYFYDQTNNPSSLFIYSTSQFWIIISYFIYSTGTLFLFVYWHKLSVDDQNKYYYLNDLFSYIRSFLLSIAMIIKEKKDEPPVNNYPMQYTL
jgi:hypothetical protein